jgi:hypothetical protein
MSSIEKIRADLLKLRNQDAEITARRREQEARQEAAKAEEAELEKQLAEAEKAEQLEREREKQAKEAMIPISAESDAYEVRRQDTSETRKWPFWK